MKADNCIRRFLRIFCLHKTLPVSWGGFLFAHNLPMVWFSYTCTMIRKCDVRINLTTCDTRTQLVYTSGMYKVYSET